MAKILIVEDNVDNLNMLRIRLSRKGYEIIIATDGKEGIDSTISDNPDLIIMDMNLPNIDGWEATRRIKATKKTQHIPILALTAYATADHRKKSMEAGCDDYDTKPIDFPRLLNKIQNLLSQ